jgi:tetratricopeptide (TPR) repeat protein
MDLFAQQKPAEARAVAEQIINESPEEFDAVHLLGVCYAALGQHGVASVVLRQAVALRPTVVEARRNLAVALKRLGQTDKAAEQLEAAAQQEPDNVDVNLLLAEAKMSLGEVEAAETICRRIVERRPEFAQAHTRLGDILLAAQKYEEAAECYRKALRLQPDLRQAHTNLGAALVPLGHPDAAVNSYSQALTLHETAEGHNNLGLALLANGRPAEAIASFERALEKRPDYVDARWNRALAKLKLGELDEGWREYEWRWKLKTLAGRPHPPQPLWIGKENLAGKSILLQCEQGLGDTIQFVRFAPAVAKLGATVTLQVQTPLVPLLRQLPGMHTVIPATEAAPTTDLYCPMLSLPLALGVTTESIPANVPYIRPSPAASAQWRKQLPDNGKLSIGVVWSGNPKHRGDRFRTLSLEYLKPLLDRDDVNWVCLQKEIRHEDWPLVWELPSLHLLGLRFSTFDDTAAVIDQLDLVISADTSVAHLTGAIAKPIWIMLPLSSDFRWMTGTDRSPWYPTARLFRQEKAADWPGVIANVNAALTEMLGAGRPRPVLATGGRDSD